MIPRKKLINHRPTGLATITRTRIMIISGYLSCFIIMIQIMMCAPVVVALAHDLPVHQEVALVGGDEMMITTVPKLSRVLDEQQWSNARLLQRRESKHGEKQQQKQQQQTAMVATNNEMDDENDDDSTTTNTEDDRELDTAENDDDLGNGDIDLTFRADIQEEESSSATDGSSSSSCKSIIAVNGWRLLASTNSSSYNGQVDNGDALYPDADVTLPYNDSSAVLPTDEEFVCEMTNGRTLPIRGTDEQVAELRHLLNKGHLVSAMSSIEVNTPQGITEGSMSSSGYSSNSVTLPDGPIQLTTTAYNSDAEERRLSSVSYEGTKLILVVRVTDRDGLAVPEDAATISDKLFGTYGDTRTMASGFQRCSFGKLLMTNNYDTDAYDNVLAAPGVVELTIDVSLQTSTQEEIAESAQRALAQKLGHSLPGPFHHIAFVLEGCYPIETTCEFAAYAFVNHWLSVFVGENFKFPAVVMHELGHNMNLAHSGGTDGEIYTDHTCLMGNPLFSDDVGMMCFNAAKNYQISVGSGSWYDADHAVSFDSGSTGGTSWRGRLIGLSDYDNNPDGHPITLKLETGGQADWFIAFNRAAGVSSDTQSAIDMVTIHRVNAGNGESYSQSFLKGGLRAGRSATIHDWRNSGLGLVIRVTEVNIDSTPGYAFVEVEFGYQ